MYACYIVFNNEPTISKSLKSILPYVEKIVAVDGAYANFPHKKPQSTDATKKIFFKLCGEKLIWVSWGEKPWLNQIVKRNEYVKRVPDGKWFIVIDGDKVIEGNVSEGFRFAEASKYICIGVRSLYYEPRWDGPYARSDRHKYAIIPKEAWGTLKWNKIRGVGTWLYLKTKGMMYRGHHSRMYVDKKIVSRPQAVLNDVFMVNMKNKMGWERWRDNLEYKTKNPIH